MTAVLSWQSGLWRAMMQNGSIRGHAVLLKGRRGIGKFSFARFLAKSLLCKNPAADHMACEHCASCNWFEQQTHPDCVTILPEAMLPDQINALQFDSEGPPLHESKIKKKSGQHISISQIRELDDLVYLSGHQSGYKTVLIYPAEAMNSAASNALLKKLEEPPEQVLFILVSHQPHRLLPTIRSRCQQIAMPVPDIRTALAWLQQASNNDDTDKLQALLAMSGYSPLAALMHDEFYETHRKFIDDIRKADQLDPLAVAEVLQNLDLTMAVEWLQKWCYDLLSCRTSGVIRFHPDREKHIQMLCKRIKSQSVLAYLRFLNTRQGLARHPLQARLFLEDILIRYAGLFASTPCALTQDSD
jgi:DNA polymerase III subunit delta'